MKSKFKILIILPILAMLISCESIQSISGIETGSDVSAKAQIKSDEFVPPHLVFNDYQVISINASEIEIDNRYDMPHALPHIEHFFPISLEITIKNLIDSKLLALGQENKLKVIIDDLSVVKEKLPEDTSFIGTFRKFPTHVLKSRIVMRFELVDANRPDVILGHSTLVAKRDRHIVDDMSISEKEHAYYQLTEDLVDDVYKGFADTVQKYFGMKEF